MQRVIEASYPLSFRQADARRLGSHIKRHDSVVLIGMKRVGISNFLRFFLYHPESAKTYVDNGLVHLFVHVDLNDLVERAVVPFWTLLLTRIVDRIQSAPLPEAVKKQSRRTFVKAIQLKDSFFTIESVRNLLAELSEHGIYPTIFFLRFDRLESAVTAEFFHNLQGLKDAARQKLSYVFTSFRPLSQLVPEVFTRQSLSVFSHDMYLPPATKDDMDVVLTSLEERYQTKIAAALRGSVLAYSAGSVQYLQLSVLRLVEGKNRPKDSETLLALLLPDEQIQLQSEELYESLTTKEQRVLQRIHAGEPVSAAERSSASYLWDTGIVSSGKGGVRVFSVLFSSYLQRVQGKPTRSRDLTRKEHLLFTFLKSAEGALCERDAIIEAVWPESRDMGVSDWSIDRLVARLRAKLKAQQSSYQVVTVVTRGYKLVRG